MRRAVTFATVLAGTLIALLGFGSATHAAVAGPQFSVVPANQSVALAAGTVSVDVAVQNPQNVGSFQFLLRYDSGVLHPDQATASAFIGSTGRQVNCPDAVIDGADGHGTILFGCATLGPPANGASASGQTTIATVKFSLTGGASTAVNIERDTLTDPTGLPLCVANPSAPRADSDYENTCPTANGSVTVQGGDPGKQTGLTASPTPSSGGGGGSHLTSPTPAPGSSPASGDPAANGTGASGTGGAPTGVVAPGAGGTANGGARGASTSAGGAQLPAGSAGGAATGVGKFGYGPPPPDHNQVPRALGAAAAMGVMGVFLLSLYAAAELRRR